MKYGELRTGIVALTNLPRQLKSLKGRTSKPSAAQDTQFQATESNRTPPGFKTRRISRSARSGSGMCSSTQIVQIASNELSANGIAVAEATTNGLWYRAATLADRSSPV